MISKILPIRLLLELGKLYARHLNGQLTSYLEEHFVLTKAQTAVRKGRSVVDLCFILAYLARKYSIFLKGYKYIKVPPKCW